MHVCGDARSINFKAIKKLLHNFIPRASPFFPSSAQPQSTINSLKHSPLHYRLPSREYRAVDGEIINFILNELYCHLMLFIALAQLERLRGFLKWGILIFRLNRAQQRKKLWSQIEFLSDCTNVLDSLSPPVRVQPCFAAMRELVCEVGPVSFILFRARDGVEQ